MLVIKYSSHSCFQYFVSYRLILPQQCHKILSNIKDRYIRPAWRNRQKSLVCSEKWSVYDHAARVTRKKVARQSAGLLSPFQNRRQFYGKVQDRNFLRPIPLSPPQCLFQPQINMFPPPLPFLRTFLLGKFFSSSKATKWNYIGIPGPFIVVIQSCLQEAKGALSLLLLRLTAFSPFFYIVPQ